MVGDKPISDSPWGSFADLMADAERLTHPAIRSCRPTSWGHIEESQESREGHRGMAMWLSGKDLELESQILIRP